MPKRKDESGFSRRSFLKTVGAGGVAAGVLTKAPAVDAQSANGVGPGPVPVTLNVNGKSLVLQIEPRVTLLDALRMRADMTGNKRGCDRGACGACTMLVDGRPVYACSTLAIDVGQEDPQRRRPRFSERQLHPVQQAFCDKDALMCGFCAGLRDGERRLLEKYPNATPDGSEESRRQHLPLRHVQPDLRSGASVKGVQRG